MRKNTITGVLIDSKKKLAKAVTIENSLHSFYNALDCSLIDRTYMSIAGIDCDVICDDEGLLKDNVPSAITADGRVQLVGSLFICHNDYKGNFSSLKPGEAEKILAQCAFVRAKTYPDGLAVVIVD